MTDRVLEAWKKEAQANQESIDDANLLLARVEQWATSSTTFPGELLDDLRVWLGPRQCGACQTGGDCTVHGGEEPSAAFVASLQRLETMSADLNTARGFFRRVLDKVPGVPPARGDELPEVVVTDGVARVEVDTTEWVKKQRERAVPVPSEVFLPRRPPRLHKGQEFEHPHTGARWRVTDVGTRTFVAIDLSQPNVVKDPSWANGPPYAIVEHVWDETDFGLLRDVPGIEWDDE